MLGGVARPRVAYVAAAAEPDAETKSWVQADQVQLRRLGYETVKLDLLSFDVGEIEACLDGVQAVFVTGGSAHRLLWHGQESGFVAAVPDRVEGGDLVYIGTSVGAIIAGPDVATVAPKNAAGLPRLRSTSGLNLVPFTVLPHDDHEDRHARNDAIVRAHPDQQFVRLRDDQAVLIDGEVTEVIDSPLLA